MFALEQKKYSIDYSLLLILFFIFIISLLLLYSGSGQYQAHDPFYYVKRQAIWYCVGIIIMAGVAAFDFELLIKWAKPLYSIGLILLILVHFFGTSKKGSQRWLSFGYFDLQPSELMKVFLIIFIAHLLIKKDKKLSFKESVPITFKILFFSLFPFYFIMAQPDLGSALVIVAITLTMVFVSSISYKMIILLLGGSVSLVGFLVYLHYSYFHIFQKIIKPHQMERIYGWLYPEAFSSSYGYQLQQAMMGIGSGQLTGAGYTAGKQVQGGNIPEAHTDFIFTVMGEEFGFIGTTILVLLYFLLIYRMKLIALHSNHLFGTYLISGVIGLISFQVFQNIAMTLGLMPITGIALPFVSYGGSALLTNMIAIGLVLSVNIRSKQYMFSNNAFF